MNPRDYLRSPRRIALSAAVILIVLCLAGFFVSKVYPFVEHRQVAERMDDAVLRLAEKRPTELTDDQWAYCVTWTWNLHCNFGSLPSYVPTRELARIERELQIRIDRGPDLSTIDWIWDQYIQSCLLARQYDHFRPTAPQNKADFEAGAHGGNPLSQWRAEYTRRVAH